MVSGQKNARWDQYTCVNSMLTVAQIKICLPSNNEYL